MANILSKIRFLPITIFASFLMLTVKVGDIWKGFDGLLNGSISVSEAKAQQGKEATAPTPEEKKPDPVEQANAPVTKEGQGDSEVDEEVSSMVSEDPTLLTQTEIDLLQQLAERRDILDNREGEINQRFGMLKAAESRIDKKVAELKLFQDTISKLIKTYDAQQDAKMGSLVKIYEAMKPKDAALIFQELDMETLLLVAERMKERKLAPIMAKMNPARATEITVELSRLRDLPNSAANEGG